MDLSSLLSMLEDHSGLLVSLVSGGLAGSIFTRVAAFRAAKKVQERISLQQSVIEYSLPGGSGSLGELRVSLNGLEFERLSLRELVVTNTSNSAVLHENSVLITLGVSAVVVKCVVEQAPDTPSLPLIETDGLPDGVFRWRVGRLLPGDWVRIRMLTSQASQFDVSYRGDPRVNVIRSGESESDEPLDREVRLMGAAAAWYVVVGVIASIMPDVMYSFFSGLIAIVRGAIYVVGIQSGLRLFRIVAAQIGEFQRAVTHGVRAGNTLGQQVLGAPNASKSAFHLSDGVGTLNAASTEVPDVAFDNTGRSVSSSTSPPK